jgi:tRNA threonylcarbamoyladenosine biosynthesis protein TsaB
MTEAVLVLGIDTCGPTGSVALGRLTGQTIEILGQTELEGRSYSSTLVSAVGELLERAGVALKTVGGIVVVHGPGSFTGVRVGLGAVKGLAEPTRIPVLAVSRLEVLAAKTGLASAALDAHRQEVFLRISEANGKAREQLAGVEELAAIASELGPAPARIAVCDDAAIALLRTAWPQAQLVLTEAPTAVDALQLCGPRLAGGESVDVAELDGHYLRRSDAEIFGEPTGTKRA